MGVVLDGLGVVLWAVFGVQILAENGRKWKLEKFCEKSKFAEKRRKREENEGKQGVIAVNRPKSGFTSEKKGVIIEARSKHKSASGCSIVL